MQKSYEYTVIPAPIRADKAAAKSGAERFALTLTAAINDMAAQGWDYIRAETLPAEERSGLSGRTTTYHNLLVFRRERRPQPVTTAIPAPAGPEEPAKPTPRLGPALK